MLIRSLYFFLVLFLFTGTFKTVGQEAEYPLMYNYQQLKEAKNISPVAISSKKNFTSGRILYLSPDTLKLPFIDDFSVNLLRKREFAENRSFEGILLQNCPDTLNTDTVLLMTDTSWNYSFNTATSKVDSTPKKEIILMWSDSFRCKDPVKQIKMWPAYYTYTFDSQSGEKTDSQLVNADSVFVLPADTFEVIFTDTASKWLTNSTFINNTYPISQPTKGIATFEGLDANGQPYDEKQNSFGGADTLLSKTINLKGLNISDSTYISFFAEPQGLGDYPNTGDSLILEFKTSGYQWQRVWGIDGFSEPVDSVFFEQYFVLLDNPAYFFNGFQFRFRNYATLAGNNDHWHLDYVRIDTGRTASDRVINDVAFTKPPASLLKNYQSMPWKQFKDDQDKELKEADALSHTFYLKNNFSISRFVPYRIISHIPAKGDTVAQSGNPVLFLNPFADTSNTTKLTGINFPAYNKDTVVLQSEYVISASTDINQNNDTLIRKQRFVNYYAHDDGSAERAFGLIGVQGQLAYRFELNKPDTLRAIQVHFARINEQSGTDYQFAVWQDLNEEPVYKSRFFVQQFFSDSANGFHTHLIDTLLKLEGIFYIGWIQSSTGPMTVGFDKNHNARENTFYNVDGVWTNSELDGAVMMRPLLGHRLAMNIDTPVREKAFRDVLIYPNPAKSYLNIDQLPEINNYRFRIFDQTGRVVKEEELSRKIYIDDLAPGLYLLRITGKNNLIRYTGKFIKTD